MFGIDKVQYITQIPRKWFCAVDSLLYLYGCDFLRVHKDKHGVPAKVGVDQEVFAQYVNSVIGEIDLSGYVKTSQIGVDGGVAAYSHTHTKDDITGFESSSLTSTVTPLADAATAVIGDSTEAARANHKHPLSAPLTSNSYTTIGVAGEGTVAANTTSFTTPGGANGAGLKLLVCTRVNFLGTYLYGFYRTLTFDQYGRISNVSAETRYEIDTPVTYTGA